MTRERKALISALDEISWMSDDGQRIIDNLYEQLCTVVDGVDNDEKFHMIAKAVCK